MKKIFITLAVILIISTTTWFFYENSKEWPIYDRFYSEEKINEREVKRIISYFPEKFGDYHKKLPSKGDKPRPFNYECYNEFSQGASIENAQFCVREVYFDYENLTDGDVVTVALVDYKKGFDDYKNKIITTMEDSVTSDVKYYQNKEETSSPIIFFTSKKHSDFLDQIGWYTKNSFQVVTLYYKFKNADNNMIYISPNIKSHIISDIITKYNNIKL